MIVDLLECDEDVSCMAPELDEESSNSDSSISSSSKAVVSAMSPFVDAVSPPTASPLLFREPSF